MRSNYYNIQAIQPNVCLVTILSCEMTEVYWKQLMADLEPLTRMYWCAWIFCLEMAFMIDIIN